MATDLKISALTSGNPAVGTDVLPIDRGGVNFSVTAASIAALAGGSTALVPGPTAGFHGWVAEPSTQPSAYSGTMCYNFSFNLNTDGGSNQGGLTAASGAAPCVLSCLANNSPGAFAIMGYAGLYSTAQLSVGSFGSFQSTAALIQTTNSRWWHGLLSIASGHAPNNTDNAAGFNLAAFRYSTSAGDTNFQCVVSDGATAVVHDSGVAADTAYHVFTIVQNATGHFLFYIDGVLVFTSTVHEPTGNLSTNCSFTNISGAGNPGVNVAYMYFWNKK